MNANELLYYLRGFFEHVSAPTPQQIQSLQVQVLQAKPVTQQFVPVEVQPGTKCGGCGGVDNQQKAH